MLKCYLFITSFKHKIMKSKQNKLLTALSLLSVLAVLEPITGNSDWRVFLTFLSFMAFIKIKNDERLKLNIDKAARNGFLSSLICLIGLVLFLTTKPNFDQIIYAVQAVLVISTLTFAISYTYFDKKGV